MLPYVLGLQPWSFFVYELLELLSHLRQTSLILERFEHLTNSQPDSDIAKQLSQRWVTIRLVI